MNLPRPLLIVVLVISVLGALSCGLGVLRGPEKRPAETPDASGRARADSLPLLAPRRVRAEEVAASPSAACSRSGSVITVTGTCTITVARAGFRPGKLVLTVGGGAFVAARVTEVRQPQRTVSTDETFGPGRTFDVTSSGSGDTALVVECASTCTLTVGP
ncbi:MAG TPA: hypothetical protein VGQ47_01550 [Candidatus Limnocylindrales bacterium]|jgi:hypothetical protein|nr:hypothetical protein [Candidatus Limnocylindrales bacterium]